MNLGNEGGGGRWKGLKEEILKIGGKKEKKKKTSSVRHDAKRRERERPPERSFARRAAKPPPWEESGSGRPARPREKKRARAGGRTGARVLGAAAAEPPALRSSGPRASHPLAGECPEAIL